LYRSFPLYSRRKSPAALVLEMAMPTDTFTQSNLNGVRPAIHAARESLNDVALELMSAPADVRVELFDSCAYRMGELVGAGLLEPTEVGDVLTGASVVNGLAMEIGTDAVQKALAAGLTAGRQSAAALKLVWSRPQITEELPQPEDEIERLARLGAFEYERVRDAEAKRLKVRVSMNRSGGDARPKISSTTRGSLGFLNRLCRGPVRSNAPNSSINWGKR
jgi:hypothetical protein